MDLRLRSLREDHEKALTLKLIIVGTRAGAGKLRSRVPGIAVIALLSLRSLRQS